MFARLSLVFVAVMFSAGVTTAGKNHPTNFDISGSATDGNQLHLKININDKGKVTHLFGSPFHFNTENWTDERNAVEEQGFYENIPTNRFAGKCSFNDVSSQCIIKVFFTEEEITTLFVSFDGIFLQDSKWQYNGVILESHSDQGMVLYHKSFEF